jgi:four helix bundle protein
VTADELQERTKWISLRVLKLADTLTNGLCSRELARQLIRSGLSVSANYRAARRARSRREFVAKIGIVVEETDETLHWLELLVDGRYVKPNLLEPLKKEARELVSVFSKTRMTARRRMTGNKTSVRNDNGDSSVAALATTTRVGACNPLDESNRQITKSPNHQMKGKKC